MAFAQGVNEELNPFCRSAEASWNIETFQIVNLTIIFSWKWLANLLIGLFVCVNWTAALLFAHTKVL